MKTIDIWHFRRLLGFPTLIYIFSVARILTSYYAQISPQSPLHHPLSHNLPPYGKRLCPKMGNNEIGNDQASLPLVGARELACTHVIEDRSEWG